jgi:hypothetical protein
MRSPRQVWALALVAGLLAGATLSGCADAGAPPAESSLTIKVQPTSGQPFTWTLTCDPAGGSHPSPKKACAVLNEIDDPFAPLDDDLVCDQSYSGPDKADIRGMWKGEPVSIRLMRINGCYTAQWESLRPVVPASTFGMDDQFTGRIRA